MNQITEQEIAKQLTQLINNNNLNQINITNENEKWQNHYNNVISELKNEIEESKIMIENFTETNLSINRIEQEGYLRCLLTMVNRFEELNKWS